MFKKRSARQPSVVGLELDASHLAAVEVLPGADMVIQRSGLAMLRPGIVRDGEVADSQALTEELTRLFGEHELPTRVRLGISNQRVVVRAMDLEPLLEDEALVAAVQARAADHIPMPMDEAVLDLQPLGIVNTVHGPRRRVVVVAVRREPIERLVQAVRDAGLSIEGIDLSAFAMVRAVGTAGPGARLYVNVAGLTNVAVAGEDGVYFARASAGGLEAMAHALAEHHDLTLKHARQWMVHVGVATPVELIEGDPVLVSGTRAVLEDGIHQVADAVRSSLEYYRMQEDAAFIEEGLLSGPAVSIPGFAEALGGHLQLPLAPAVVGAGDGQEPPADLGRLTVAAGLAVEERDLRAAA